MRKYFRAYTHAMAVLIFILWFNAWLYDKPQRPIWGAFLVGWFIGNMVYIKDETEETSPHENDSNTN